MSPSNPQPAHLGRLRVQIHLNLGKPGLAENVVRIRSASGAWVAVAYANELLLENVVPVVNRVSQEKIDRGDSRKVPHAFIEGELVHFKGRLRDKAPSRLKNQAAPFLTQTADFEQVSTKALMDDVRINYNPRFAGCFYRDNSDKTAINERFVAAAQMVAIGWNFWAVEPGFTPLLASDRCAPSSLAKASPSEHVALIKGRSTTRHLIASRVSATKQPGRLRPLRTERV